MEDIVADVILGVYIEPALTLLQQIDERFDLIVLDCHEKSIFTLFCYKCHVGTKILQKQYHIDIALKSGKVDCSKSLLIWRVDPGLDFGFEPCGVHFVSMGDFAVGLEML